LGTADRLRFLSKSFLGENLEHVHTKSVMGLEITSVVNFDEHIELPTKLYDYLL